jgi:hypothetical protein
MKRYLTCVVAFLLLLLVTGGACAQEPVDGATPVASKPLVDIPPEAETVMLLVVADAAQRAGVDPSQVSLVSIEAVQWPDASLGCPQSGMMYIQMITPGYRVMVAAAGVQQEYHTDSVQSIVLCGS